MLVFFIKSGLINNGWLNTIMIIIEQLGVININDLNALKTTFDEVNKKFNDTQKRTPGDLLIVEDWQKYISPLFSSKDSTLADKIDTSTPNDDKISFDEFSKWLNDIVPIYVTEDIPVSINT